MNTTQLVFCCHQIRRNGTAVKVSSRRAAMLAIHNAFNRGISTASSSENITYSSSAPAKQINRIELVPLVLHRHLFGEGSASTSQIEQMALADDPSVSGLDLPELRVRGNLMQHFSLIAQEQFDSYEELLNIAVKIPDIPMPTQWKLQTGWTAYEPGSNMTRTVLFPEEQLIFFDVETCVKDGQLPTLAVALSPTKWYLWCSDRLVNNSPYPEFARLKHLIPVEDLQKIGMEKKIVIGHNIAYDRTRIREQYLPNKSATSFWCTMSMSIAISGMSDSQRLLYMKNDAKVDLEEDVNEFYGKSKLGWLENWRKRTSKNALIDVHNKYCPDSEFPKLDKSLRDTFTKEDISVIRDNFQALASYCAYDVRATLEIYRELYPLFRERFPSSVTYAGMLEMAGVYLPVNANWRHFAEKCNRDSCALKDDAARSLVSSARSLAATLCAETVDGQKEYENDPWMWTSNWKKVGKEYNCPEWFRELFIAKTDAKLPDESISTTHIKPHGREVSRIFGLCYGPYPIFYKRYAGWGFFVPSEKNKDDLEVVQLRRGAKVTLPVEAINKLIEKHRYEVSDLHYQRWKPAGRVGPFDFYKLPHSSGNGNNVGNPFSKGFDNDFEHKVMFATRFADVLEKFLRSTSDTHFWTSYSKRYRDELVVWLDDAATAGAIAPPVAVAGTVTRRTTHKLWLTSANPRKNLIGSDLKSMVQVHEGWKLVGADVDSQEQWLAAIFGDSASEEHRAGATQFSNMLLAGDKAKQTDLHSVVAKEVGISRDNAKTLNYARLYGSGLKHAVDFLKQRGILEHMARDLASKLFKTTKGQQGMYRELKQGLIPHFECFLSTDCPRNLREQHLRFSGRYFLPSSNKRDDSDTGVSEEFQQWISKRCSAETRVDFHKMFKGQPVQLYRGGYESYTFNFLETLSREPQPKTPILRCRLSTALEPQNSGCDHSAFNSTFKRTIVNWFVQSSGVDFLHMLLVCMRWLCEEYGIDARLAISIHDEVRYLVKDEDKYRCALALTLSNMYVRAAISSQMGINELPKSVAFFSQVDVDTVLRKEVNIDVIQPNTGERIPHGEALSMEEIMKKTGGKLSRDEEDTVHSHTPTYRSLAH